MNLFIYNFYWQFFNYKLKFVNKLKKNELNQNFKNVSNKFLTILTFFNFCHNKNKCNKMFYV